MKALILSALLLVTAQFAAATGVIYQRVIRTFGANSQISTVVVIKPLESVYYSVASNAGATILLESSRDGGRTFVTVQSFASTTGSGYIQNLDVGKRLVQYRFRVSAYSSGSPVVKLNQLPYFESGKKGKRLFVTAAGSSKFNSASGWSVDGTGTQSYVHLPASKTAATMNIAIPQLPIGAVLKSFNFVGVVLSTGGAVTLDGSLSVGTAVSSGVSEAVSASITQVSVATGTNVDYTNSEKVLSEPLVQNEDQHLYLTLTGTTASSTSIQIQGAVIEFDEP